MNFNLKNAGNDDLAHIVVRMNAAEYQALRNYMHSKDGEFVWFPYGAFLAPRGRGWYRVSAHQPKRAADKVAFALTVLKRFLRDEEDKIVHQIKRLVPVMMDPDLKVTSFSNAHSEGEWGYLGSPHLAPKPAPQPQQAMQPASPQRLQMLAAKFARNQPSK